MNKLFFALLFLFASLKLGALHHPIFDGGSLEDHKNSTPISAQILDKLTEEAMQTLCMFGVYEEETAGWTNLWSPATVEKTRATAFFITSDGHFLINKQIIKPQSDITVFLHQKEMVVTASLIAEHPTEKIALFKIDKPSDMTLSYLNIASNEEEVGNWIFSLRGCALIYNNTLVALPSIGKIVGHLQDYAASTIPFGDGNAGSPVLNVEGKVIGILSGNVNFSNVDSGRSGMSATLPIYHLKSWIEEALRSSGYVEPLK
ncbi:MAG TPA: serine protease [Rhabdochlamydiaceae bacterium]|nr:serine protease [Rhabdochlamydiaceae bacterium]